MTIEVLKLKVIYCKIGLKYIACVCKKRKGVRIMSEIRTMKDLKNKPEDIIRYCRETKEAVYITDDGVDDIAVVNLEEYEKQKALLELYEKLWEAENENDGIVEDFEAVAEELRSMVHGKV